MKRRRFLQTAGMVAATVPVHSFLSASVTKDKKLPRTGIILGNTGGEWVRQHPREALRSIAELGYRELEFGGDIGLGMNAGELVGYLKSIGLKPLIGPTSMAALHKEELLKSDIHACQERGQKFIACYWPWTDDGKNKLLDDWKRVADSLNRGGAICKKEGVQLIYHNHDIEFKPAEDQIPFDTLMKHLDPALVGIELDLYWVTKGGQSPTDCIRKYPGRYPVFHVKDMKPTDGDFACVGSGCIDFPAIFRLNAVAGVKHFIVEHDRPEDPKTCIETSAQYLSSLRF
ncbi:MAG: sugar phosphate isomerase/epimerase [Tannerella sp.]|jgi:sugar phosphate isomerase/epimerase|nr:sugar phosphate isomerase/epimerase [Tannerella sp.]